MVLELIAIVVVNPITKNGLARSVRRDGTSRLDFMTRELHAVVRSYSRNHRGSAPITMAMNAPMQPNYPRGYPQAAPQRSPATPRRGPAGPGMIQLGQHKIPELTESCSPAADDADASSATGHAAGHAESAIHAAGGRRAPSATTAPHAPSQRGDAAPKSKTDRQDDARGRGGGCDW